MKTKRILSIALSLFLILSLLPMTAFADMSGTEEGTENVSFTMSVSIADGTTAPDSYGVEYRVVDAEGNDVKESGYSSYITNAEPMRISLSGLQSDYQVKIKAYSAGLGIRLSGADVSEEGWSEGKTISLTEINGKNYNYEFFQKAGAPNPGEGGNQDPGEGGSQRSPIQIELRNGQNGTTEYKVNDEWIYLSNSQSIEGVANGATVYVRAMPNGGQEIDTTGTQFWKDGKQESIDTNELQTSEGWSFTYNEGSNYDVCIEYRGNGGDNGGSGNQSTSGEFRFKCQSQMITGGSIFYKLNNADDFEQVQVNEENNQYASLTLNEAVTSITIKFVPNEGYQLDTTRGVTLRINGDLKYQADGVYISDFTSDSGHMFNLREMIGDTEEGAGSVLNSSFELEFGFENGNPGPGPEEPGEPPHGGYTGNRVTADVTITGKADFCINDSNWIHESKKVDYTYDAAKETVDFYVSWFINEKYTSFTINGVDYLDELPTEKQDLLDACKGQLYEIRIEVPYSEKYEISATKEEVKGEDMPVGNFLWSYTNPQQKDDYIDHGHMELVSVNYGGETYSPEQLNNPGSAFDWSESAEGGSAVLPADAVVTVRLVPDYGYQLTSFGINGGEFDTHDEQSTFTFVIKGGNFHLGARFTEVEDKVASTSNAVASGSIQLGENEIDTGSVVLSVGDADLTDEQKTAFSNAGDGNYEVSTYLDINLNQVLYKGTTDEDDVWTTPLGKEKTLKSPATVTLKLDEGVDGNNVVILHETHDGIYEVIEATYDAENHTITFITDSFSNYAIAVEAPISKKSFFVNFDPWGEGESAHAKVMAQIGNEDAVAVEAWKMNSVDDENAQIRFTLLPPEERANMEPIVEVRFWTGEEEPVVKSVELTKNADNDGTYSFTVTPEIDYIRLDVFIWWSEFDQFEPNENEIVIHTNVPDGNKLGMIQLNQEAVRKMSLGTETKYIFSAETEVSAEFVPAKGKRLMAVIAGDAIYGDGPTEDFPEENVHALSELKADGKYVYTVNLQENEFYLYLEAIFDDCDHTMMDLIPATEATCTEAGNKAYYICSCGEWFEDAEANDQITSEDWVVIPAKGHKVAAKSQEPTLDQDGYKTYYECERCQKAFTDAQGKNEITDLTAWKTGEGRIPSLGEQFEVYKKDGQVKADSKKQAGDSATVTKLIETAKAAINALSYDSSKNLDGNKKNVDDILNKMAKDIAAQKITEAGFIPNEIEEKPTTGDVVNITSEVKDNSLNASLSNIPAGAITLTEEESENGAYVWLELNTVNDDSATAAAFEGKLSGYSVGAYMEIDLFKMTMDGDVTTISDTNSAVSVTVTVPDSLLNKDKDILRTFYIARNHNGNVEILGASYDANNKTLTFKTDKFSDYAIIYKDAQKNITVADNPTNVDKTVPKTGDNSNQLLWITLLMISAMCVFGICIRGKRRTQ